LGLLYADGCIMKVNIILGLIESDRELLDKLNTIIYQNKKPLSYTPAKRYIGKTGRVTNNHPQYRLTLNSKKCVEDIKKLGCIPRKSLILRFPQKGMIPDHLFNHFIRGYFDGDGYFHHSKKSKSSTISIISSHNYCIGFQKFLMNKLKILSHLKKEKSISRVNVNRKEDIIKIYNYMYHNAAIYLNRKKEKIESWVKQL
jgi:LAGLIDADG-like domain